MQNLNFLNFISSLNFINFCYKTTFGTMANIIDKMQVERDAFDTLWYEYKRRRVEINARVYKARYILTKAVCSKLNMQENWTYFFDPSGKIIVRNEYLDSEIIKIIFLNQPMSGDFLFKIASYGHVTSLCRNMDGLIDEVNRRLKSYEP